MGVSRLLGHPLLYLCNWNGKRAKKILFNLIFIYDALHNYSGKK